MSNLKISDILRANTHRSWPMPSEKWSYYQEWNQVVFLHWRIPAQALEKLLPKELQLDLIDGEAWVSLVPFTMEKIRPRLLPSVDFVSNFHEINLRTYVVKDGKAGVYFLNIEAQKWFSAWVSEKASGLPYKKAEIKRYSDLNCQVIDSASPQKNLSLHLSYTPGALIDAKSELETWLTERYCLYVKNDHQMHRYEIQHLPWQLHDLQINKLQLHYRIGTITIHTAADFSHYSPGVQVVAWSRSKIK